MLATIRDSSDGWRRLECSSAVSCSLAAVYRCGARSAPAPPRPQPTPPHPPPPYLQHQLDGQPRQVAQRGRLCGPCRPPAVAREGEEGKHRRPVQVVEVLSVDAVLRQLAEMAGDLAGCGADPAPAGGEVEVEEGRVPGAGCGGGEVDEDGAVEFDDFVGAGEVVEAREGGGGAGEGEEAGEGGDGERGGGGHVEGGAEAVPGGGEGRGGVAHGASQGRLPLCDEQRAVVHIGTGHRAVQVEGKGKEEEDREVARRTESEGMEEVELLRKKSTA